MAGCRGFIKQNLQQSLLAVKKKWSSLNEAFMGAYGVQIYLHVSLKLPFYLAWPLLPCFFLCLGEAPLFSPLKEGKVTS